MEAERKICGNCQKEFTIESEDFNFYEKMKLPPPTVCSECRRQRRWSWKNNTSLYKRTCDLCKKNIISIYSPESDLVVYCVKCWWSDKWDPKSYGADYDFSKPFFTQFQELASKVPRLALINDDGIASVNCEYTQDFAFGKNCYMVFIAWHIENVMYSYFMLKGKDMIDCMHIGTSAERMYECINCGQSFDLKNSELCKACIDSSFLYNCLNCQNCFMCAGLRNKKYYYQNKEYSKEEYEKILASYDLDTFSGVERAKKEYEELIEKFPRRFGHLNKCVNCVGYLISGSKNCKDCFILRNSENSKYCDLGESIEDCYDLSGGGEISESYESVTSDQSSRNFFGLYSWKNQDVQYTQHCHSSKDLFGCFGIKKGKYCILNKQYTQEGYQKLVPKIIEHMNNMPYMDRSGNSYKYGEFYPIELSPFGYNETEAMEHFPLSEDDALSRGYKWQNSLQLTTGKETLKAENIPESISDVKDEILNEVLACVECRRNYKITPNELTFYRKMKVPIPRRCFYCRHSARLARRNPFKLWHRSCMCDRENHFHEAGKCKEEFETSYAPERPEIIFCEKCYHQEVY